MPKVLIEVDADNTFDQDVVVPDGDDDMDDAADVVESIAQRLTNRTRYLTNRTGKLAGNNTWSGDNVFQGATEVHTTLHIDPDTADTPGIHIDRTPGADYQEMISARNGSGSDDRVRIYAGNNSDTQGAMFFVANARYEVGSPSAWRQINTSKPSTALILRDGDVRVVTKPAGVNPSTWSSWQQSTIAEFDSTVLAEIIRTARVYTTGPTTMDHSNGFRYTTPVPRTSPIPLGQCWGNIGYGYNGLMRNPFVYNDGAFTNSEVWIPVPVPPFSTFGIVRVRFMQRQTDNKPDRFRLYQRVHDSAWQTLGEFETLASYSADNTTSVVIELHPGAEQLVLDGEEYAYQWTSDPSSSDDAAKNNRIVGASVEWTDYGPVNRVG